MQIELFDKSFETIEEYIETHRVFDLVAYQITSGRFFNQHKGLNLPRMSLGQRTVVAETIHFATLKPDDLYMVFPDSHVQIVVNGAQMTHDRLIAFTKGEDLIVRYPQDYKGRFLSVQASVLADYLDDISFQRLMADTAVLREADVTSEQFKLGRVSLIEQIDSIVKHAQQLQNNPIAIKDAEESILLTLAASLNAWAWRKQVIKQNSRHTIVQRAIDYVDSTGDFFIAIPRLAEVCFCSLRTLEYAFKSILHISPKRYLTIRRMHLIRQALLTNPVSQAQRVIRGYGVVNTGRFAKDYYQLFGELPKQTAEKTI
ncbi:hypothetical protein C2869_13795 [Saccharobesus litoralis]|uniref:HTH araC/xylS-type domain-containing protein n=1 Tax=Saccharobesus litoralis TaxID=2172099 RepID=A0A2S0VTB1_9ALTE|nr:AraC family transcriptional regulator [Saccharobesus litoralis]AWB67447.1 hypothetical protein C2869_13795 [Saccharobesus litoralis]